MGTVTEQVARVVVANEGFYPGDSTRVQKVVRYRNVFSGNFSYGLVYPQDDYNCYEKSPACYEVTVLWSLKDGLLTSF
jgi:hypothetical protein